VIALDESQINRILEQNNEELKKIGKYHYLPHRSPGEWVVADLLKRMNIRYIPEYVMKNLRDDHCKYRIADFYLPREDVIIEHCGGWSTSNEEKSRYRQKRKIYLRNNVKHLFIYPKELNFLDPEYLKYKIEVVMRNGRGWDPSKDTQLIQRLKYKLKRFFKSMIWT